MSGKTLVTNRKAGHEYHLSDRFEAGISLRGTEVKSIRASKINITDGWVDVSQEEAILREVHIGHYSHGNIMNHEEKRPRKLLLHKREIQKLAEASEVRGYSIVPVRVYLVKNWVKVEIALAKGKKLHDKRAAAKDKDAKREMARAVKHR